MKLKGAVIKQIHYCIRGYMFSKISPPPSLHSQGRCWGGGVDKSYNLNFIRFFRGLESNEKSSPGS